MPTSKYCYYSLKNEIYKIMKLKLAKIKVKQTK